MWELKQYRKNYDSNDKWSVSIILTDGVEDRDYISFFKRDPEIQDIMADINARIFDLNAPTPDVTVTLSPISIALESAKETLKWLVINKTIDEPTITFAQMESYIATQTPWNVASVLNFLIYQYCVQAREAQLITFAANETADQLFVKLRGVLTSHEYAEIVALLAS